MTHTNLLAVDIARGTAYLDDLEVEVAVPVIIHLETGQIVWQSDVAVPFQVVDWLERCVGQLATVHVEMIHYWIETAVVTDWFLQDPSDENPFGIRA
jgi:hypothetical protein